MNFLRRFSMTKERWLEERKMGQIRYILFKGVLELGLGGGTIFLFLKYFSASSFSFDGMSFHAWFSDYLVWLPVAIVVGIFFSSFAWYSFEQKYRDVRAE